MLRRAERPPRQLAPSLLAAFAAAVLLVVAVAVVKGPHPLRRGAATVVSLHGRAPCVTTATPRRRMRGAVRAEVGDGVGRRDVIKAPPSVLTTIGLAFSALSPEKSDARPRSEVSLLSADPVYDPKELLRRALPVQDTSLDSLQEKLFAMSKSIIGGNVANKETRDSNTMIGTTGIEISTAKVRISSASDIRGLANECKSILSAADEITNSILQDKSNKKGEEMVGSILGDLKGNLNDMLYLLNGDDEKYAQKIYLLQQDSLDLIGNLKEMKLDKFPYAIPKEYQSYDKLLGRAVAEIKIRTTDDSGTAKVETLRVVLDGYNAPITAGRFARLAKQGFYDGMTIQRSDGFIVQSGKNEGTAAPRAIPLEIMVQGDKSPTYGDTLESLFRFDEKVVLPFNAQGTLAMARNADEANSGDTQFFWLNKENDLTPSGTNILDGRFAVFGYTVENANALRDFRVGDVIESVKIIEGVDRLTK